MNKSKRKYTDEQFIEAVRTSFSSAEVFRKLNIAATGGNYRYFKILVEKLSLNTDHFTGMGYLKGKTHNWSRTIPIKDLLVKNNYHTNSNRFKKRLIKEGYFLHKCCKCNLLEWFGLPIPIQLDHINGDKFDFRLENLRILCPNCHAQTDTYCR